MTNVHTLWTGQTEVGLLERLTLASFRRFGCKVHVWAFKDLAVRAAREFPGAEIGDAGWVYPETEFFLNDRFEPGQRYQHFSDLFRMKVVRDSGEWWTDLDVTLLRPLPDGAPYAHLSAHDLQGFSMSLFCFPKGSPVLVEALTRAEHLLRPPGVGEWMGASRILREVLGEKYFYPECLFCGNDSTLLLEPMRRNPGLWRPDWQAIHWCGSSFAGKDQPVPESVYWQLLKQYQLI